MSEEQLKAAEAEAAAQVEDGVEEISEEDLAGVAGGSRSSLGVVLGVTLGNSSLLSMGFIPPKSS